MSSTGYLPIVHPLFSLPLISFHFPLSPSCPSPLLYYTFYFLQLSPFSSSSLLSFTFIFCPATFMSPIFHYAPIVVANVTVLFSSAGSHDTCTIFFPSACCLSLHAVTQHSFYAVPPNNLLQPVVHNLHKFYLYQIKSHV